jgi:hypothetical protein
LGAQIVQNLPEDHWRSFVDEQPQGNIFHTPEMYQVYARARGHDPAIWAATDRSSSPRLLLIPVEVTVMGTLLHPFTRRAVAYGSVLWQPGSEDQAALSELLRAYLQSQGRGTLFTELRNLSDLAYIQPVLEAHGFRYHEHLNFIIDLSRPPEQVLQGMGRRTRKQIRRALRRDIVRITEISHADQLAILYGLLQRTYAAARVPLADRTLFEAAFSVLHPRGMAKFLLAWVGDDCAACSVELLYKDKIYGWYSGVDRAYSTHVPNELLTWYILRWGAENGYRLYDFGGAGKPEEDYGVRDFKAKFGGQLVCYGRNTHVHSPVRLWLGQQAYNVWRRWF